MMELTGDFVFLRPWWLLLLPLGVVLVYFVKQRTGGSWQQICDSALLPQLLVGGKSTSHLLSRLAILFGWIIGVIALAGPAWDKQDTPLYKSVDAMVLVVDLSHSMNAADIAPSRLERAKFKAIETIEKNPGVAVGLVVFAGDAFDVAPVSEDAATVIHLLKTLSTDIVPLDGNQAGTALVRAIKLLDGSGIKSGTIVLFTDGVSEAHPQVKQVADSGYILNVVGVGTDEGAVVPTPDGTFLSDDAGNVLLSRLDRDQLQDLASAANGKFYLLTTDEVSLNVADLGFFSDEQLSRGRHDVATTQWNDRGAWLLLLLIPLAALMFRRGWLFALCLYVPFTIHDAHAFDWQSLFKRGDQRTSDAIASGDYQTAVNIAPDATWRGIAHYRAGDFPQATKSFEQLDGTAEAHYNYGNALAKSGHLHQAVEQYDAAIELSPEFEDAIFNRDLLLSLLEQLSISRGEGDGQQGEQGDQLNDTPGDGSSEEGQFGRTLDDPMAGTTEQNSADSDRSSERSDPQDAPTTSSLQSDDDSTDQDDSEGGDRSISVQQAEQAQIMEQWLRSIPDDPSGLLRRKFLYQSRVRAENAGS